MVETYDDDDEIEDELQSRNGQFLRVEPIGAGYRETSVKGLVTEYQPSEQDLKISIEGIALHATSDIVSGKILHFLTGQTCEKFRAIGTEGNYRILDVSISSKIANGTGVIRKVYDQGGNALNSQMSIGLPEESIKALGERLPGNLWIGGMEKSKFYSSDNQDGTIILDHWRSHAIPDFRSGNVTAEWEFIFETATISPEGYSGGWLGYIPPPNNGRRVSGDVGIHFRDGHPLKKSIDQITETFLQAAQNITRALFVIAAALVYLAYKSS